MDKVELDVVIERLENMTNQDKRDQEQNYREHREIIEQVKKTNGIVRTHDKFIWMIMGALTLMSAFVLPIVFIIAQNYFK
jgi:hypothetical protein